jgi:hypothetical protein
LTSYQAAIDFSLVMGMASRKVCIGALSKAAAALVGALFVVIADPQIE